VIFKIEMSRPSDKMIPKDFSQAYEDIFNRSLNRGDNAVYLGKELTIVL